MSPSNPTIRYVTSSTELFSFLESGKKEDDDDVGSISVGRLRPPDVLFGDDVVAMMSSGSNDVVVVGNSGTADVVIGAGVGL